ncbi:hypothetical protein [Cellulomonas sp. SLBN-39]|uniref:hypothetical protein n=1 Tax=Cellulomonas sp. SLBN-39 TaxID=2768446 RepID=UPI00114F3541|nr:hypothetical protein [Cellulomonas sp. SLBN-39]TQL02797.1 hypothetical protein FBY24_1882 [Cellulomonas sp. SLBN-39]
MQDEVQNRYRDELGAALPAERFRAEVTAGMLRTVQDALAQGAWVSTTADRFAAVCAEQGRILAGVADAAYEELTDRYAREPVTVPVTDRRARFQG